MREEHRKKFLDEIFPTPWENSSLFSAIYKLAKPLVLARKKRSNLNVLVAALKTFAAIFPLEFWSLLQHYNAPLRKEVSVSPCPSPFGSHNLLSPQNIRGSEAIHSIPGNTVSRIPLLLGKQFDSNWLLSSAVWKILSRKCTENGHRAAITISYINCLPLWRAALSPRISFLFSIFRNNGNRCWRGGKYYKEGRRSMRFHKCLSVCALLYFHAHFVKWLDNPLFTGDDDHDHDQEQIPESRKTFGHFFGSSSGKILKFVSRFVFL